MATGQLKTGPALLDALSSARGLGDIEVATRLERIAAQYFARRRSDYDLLNTTPETSSQPPPKRSGPIG